MAAFQSKAIYMHLTADGGVQALMLSKADAAVCGTYQAAKGPTCGPSTKVLMLHVLADRRNAELFPDADSRDPEHEELFRKLDELIAMARSDKHSALFDAIKRGSIEGATETASTVAKTVDSVRKGDVTETGPS